MINSYFHITVVAEWITFFAALFLLDKRTTIWRLFVVLLFLILCTETIGWYMKVKLHNSQNALPFNLLNISSIIFFIWFLSKSPLLSPVKKTLSYANGLFALFAVANLLFFQGLHRYNSITEAVGDIMLVLLCCYFLFRTVQLDEPINLLKLDYFWLATGLLFYCLGSALLYPFSYVLMDYYKQTGINMGSYINYSLNLLLYTGFIISFICRRQATR